MNAPGGGMTDAEMLDCLEAALACVSAALKAQDAEALEAASTQLHEAARTFAQLAGQRASGRPPGVERLAVQLAQQRGQLARLCVSARQRTAALLPEVEGPGALLYGPQPGGPAARPGLSWRGQV